MPAIRTRPAIGVTPAFVSSRYIGAAGARALATEKL